MQGAHRSPLRVLVNPLLLLFLGSIAVAVIVRQPPSLRWAVQGSSMPAVVSGIGLVTVWIRMAVANVRVGALVGGGQSTVRWVIEGDRWEAFARRRRDAAGKEGRTAGVAVAAFLLLALLTMGSGESDRVFLGWLGLGVAGLVVVVRRFAPRPSDGGFSASVPKGKVLVGETYAVINGHLCSWSGPHTRVTKVEVDEERGVLRVDTRFARVGRRTQTTHLEIPFPVGAEEEARAVASRLAGTE